MSRSRTTAPGAYFFRDEAHRPFRRVQVSAVSGRFAQRCKQQRRCCGLRIEVTELGPWLQVSVIPGGNYAAGKLMLHKEIAIRTDEGKDLLLPVRGQVLAPFQHPIRRPRHTERVVIITKSGPAVVANPALLIQ